MVVLPECGAEAIYSRGGVVIATYTQVTDSGSCTPTSFFFDGLDVVLCPEACAVVAADDDAQIDGFFPCSNPVGKE
ncbi:MAG: hypothetical protein AAF928_20550 [Myxococcota bacterium]